MLVLQRKEGQRIIIGGAVAVTVLEVQNGRVKLGVEGPPEVPIHREEVFRRIQQENARAARALTLPR